MGEDDYSSGVDAEIRPANAVFTLGPELKAIPMHLHHSLGRGGREAIAKKISGAGGDPTVNEDEAEVIICRDDNPAFKQLEWYYEHHRYVWVEAPSWVDICLRRRRYEHVQPGRLAVKQRVLGNSRVEFTQEDDEHLARYLALRIPFKEAGGRNGNGVYKDLVHPDRENFYPWAKRHTWQSWRERYIKNSEIFDSAIKRIVNSDPDPPAPGGKGQYLMYRKPKKIHLRQIVEHEEDTDEQEELQEDDEIEVIEDPAESNPVSHGDLRPKVDPRRRRIRTTPMDVKSPPQKKARKQADSSEEEIDSGIGHVSNKGKMRQDDPEHASSDGDFTMGEPGPSQFNAQIDDPKMPPPSGSANLSHVPPSADAQSSDVVSSKNKPPPLPRNKRTAKKPPDSQRTIVEEAQVQQGVPPPDTQATLLPSPQLHRASRPERRQALSAPQPKPYPNTRSRPQAESSSPVASHSPNRKRGRGRPRKKVFSAPRVELPRQVTPVQASDVAPSPDQVRVEALLQSKGEDEGGAGSHSDNGDDGSVSLSSDDDAAERELLDGQRNLVSAGPSYRHPSKNTRPAKPTTAPQVGLQWPIRANATRRDSQENDQDATPKALVPGWRAKKTAARNVQSVSDESREVSSEVSTGTTSSFPSEVTNAWEYKTANSPFTPGRGTRAEQYAQRTTIKGKRKA